MPFSVPCTAQLTASQTCWHLEFPAQSEPLGGRHLVDKPAHLSGIWRAWVPHGASHTAPAPVLPSCTSCLPWLPARGSLQAVQQHLSRDPAGRHRKALAARVHLSSWHALPASFAATPACAPQRSTRALPASTSAPWCKQGCRPCMAGTSSPVSFCKSPAAGEVGT